MSVDFISDNIVKINALLTEPSDLPLLIEEIESSDTPDTIALLLEAFPVNVRLTLWPFFSIDVRQQIFLAMKEESRKLLLNALEDNDCYPLFEKLDASTLLELSLSLSGRFIDFAVSNMTAKQRSLYKKSQDYNTNEMGYWQAFDDIQIPHTLKVSAVKKVCSKNLPSLSDAIYIVDKEHKLLGEIKLSLLFKADDNQTIESLVNEVPQTLNVNANIDQCIADALSCGKAALPVIDNDGRLTGRLDVQTAYKFRDQQKESQLIQSNGLTEEEDLFASVWSSSKNRAVWLGINLITAFLASWFIGLFEATLAQVVALAVLMPVVASMGGISGSQTLTLIIRGLALGQLTDANRKDIVLKELKVGMINGLLWAIVIAFITNLWFGNPLLSLTIFFAILGNIIIASLSGVWVPWILKKLNIDPALSGAVILTTVTDIFGFITFLGLGSLFLV